MRCYVTVILGVFSSIAVGGCLAGVGANIGELLLALKNTDEKKFDTTFAIICVFLILTIASKTACEYFMRSVGLMKRTHLNNRLQSM
jgi:hypothetical protein